MKEKIIALIQESVGGCARYWAELIADHLIANGATLNKWIPVEERLPDPKEYDWVLGAVKTTECSLGDNWYLPPQIVECRNGKWWGDGDFPISALSCEVTHWMPLPELPKNEEEEYKRLLKQATDAFNASRNVFEKFKLYDEIVEYRKILKERYRK